MTTSDRLTVTAETPADAKDIARRQWEREGFRVVSMAEPYRDGERWVVWAEVEPVRSDHA